ncbi:MAG: WG repeat-containing protein [Ginsengibacter sp.]
MENNKLIKFEGGLIKRVGNAINVTNKLLAKTEPQLIPYRKKDKWGFCTTDKRIVIDCIFNRVQPFQDNLALIEIDGKTGFINNKGHFICDCQYDKTYYSLDFSFGFCAVSKNAKWGFIGKQGNPLTDFIFDYAYEFSEGLAAVKLDGKWGYIDQKGNLVIDFRFEKSGPFIEGLAFVGNNKCGYINAEGSLIIPYKFDDGGCFSEGLADVAIDKNYGFINKKGDLVIPCKFSEVKEFKNGIGAVFLNDSNRRFGLHSINKEGGLVSFGDFHYACFSEGLAAVLNHVSGKLKFGFINEIGEILIPCQFDKVEEFSEGYAVVGKEIYENDRYYDTRYGIINKLGEFLIPYKYTLISSFKNGIARVFKSHLLYGSHILIGYINKIGIEYWED